MNTGFLAPGTNGDGFFAPPAGAVDPSLDFSVDTNSMYEFLMF